RSRKSCAMVSSLCRRCRYVERDDQPDRSDGTGGCERMTETCRFCATRLATTVADLGLTPVSNELRDIRDVAGRGQTFYPLKAMVCEACWLVQLARVETPAHFTEDYVYFSSISDSWLRHAQDYAHAMIAAQALN